MNFCGDIGQRGRAKAFGWDIIEDGTEGICELSEACAKGAGEVTFGSEACSQVKVAFFCKNARCAPAGRGAPARLVLTDIGALRLALKRKSWRLSPPRARFCPRGGVQRKGVNRVFVYFLRARGRILADAPATRLHAR